jgi:hypothetical protein
MANTLNRFRSEVVGFIDWLALRTTGAAPALVARVVGAFCTYLIVA